MRSLLPKIDELRILARDYRAACICVTETWIDGTVLDSEIHIDNYSVRPKDRNRHGGGVCLYIRSELAFNGLDELSHDEIEAVWIELSSQRLSQSFVVWYIGLLINPTFTICLRMSACQVLIFRKESV